MFDEQPDGDPHGECAAEIHSLETELAACANALPGPLYMDPPDGGDVLVSEQLRRMAQDAARYHWLRAHNDGSRDIYRTYGDKALDEAIDAAMLSNVQSDRLAEDKGAREK